jgi:hypothetical protein
VKHWASDSLVDAALAYRRDGFSMIPIERLHKRALVVSECHRNKAASDAQIQSRWTEWPGEAVAVIAQQAAQPRRELHQLGEIAELLRAGRGSPAQAEKTVENVIDPLLESRVLSMWRIQ